MLLCSYSTVRSTHIQTYLNTKGVLHGLSLSVEGVENFFNVALRNEVYTFTRSRTHTTHIYDFIRLISHTHENIQYKTNANTQTIKRTISFVIDLFLYR